MAKENNIVMSDDIFDEVCDLLGIAKDDRAITSISVNLSIGEPATYSCDRYAVRRVGHSAGGDIPACTGYRVGE
jgi:hypothetical protein